MSLTTRLYIALVVTLGAVALAHGLSLWNLQDPLRFYCYLLLAIPASCLKVTIPGVTGTMSVLSLFLLAGVVELGIPETLVIGVTCVVIQCFWHARLRPRPVQIVFSVADIVLAITAALQLTVVFAAASLSQDSASSGDCRVRLLRGQHCSHRGRHRADGKEVDPPGLE